MKEQLDMFSSIEPTKKIEKQNHEEIKILELYDPRGENKIIKATTVSELWQKIINYLPGERFYSKPLEYYFCENLNKILKNKIKYEPCRKMQYDNEIPNDITFMVKISKELLKSDLIVAQSSYWVDDEDKKNKYDAICHIYFIIENFNTEKGE